MNLLALHLVPFALIAFRVLGVFLAVPLVGGSLVPIRLKVLFGLALAGAVYPVVGGTGVAPAETSLFALVPMCLLELLIGACIGFLAGMPLHAANLAGFLMSHQMGLGLARTYDPGSDAETDLLSQLLFILAAGAFLAIGGLESLFLGVATSFDRIPVGTFHVDHTPMELAIGLIGSGFELALRVSAPVVGIVMLVMVALAVLNKTLPQINAMTVGFMLKIIMGTVMLVAGVSSINDALVEDVGSVLRDVLHWFGTRMGGGA